MAARADYSRLNRLAPVERGLVAGTAVHMIEGAGLLAFGRSSAIERMAESLTIVMPPTWFAFLLDNLLYSAKPLLLIGLIIGMYVVSIGLGVVFQATGVTGVSRRSVLIFGAVAVLLFGLDALILRPDSPVAGLVLTAGAAVAFLSVFALASRPPSPVTAGVPGRRMLLAGLLGFSASLAIGVYYWSTILAKSAPITARSTPVPAVIADSDEPSSKDKWAGIDYLSPEITPTDEFYFVSKNFIDPRVQVEGWNVTVEGLVENPLSFTYEEFKGLPSEDQFNTLICISNNVGGDLIGNAHWRGARLRSLLERAAPLGGVSKVVFHAADGYADSITFDVAMRSANLLAYEMNGEPLTDTHGFPLRLLVPGIYGMKNVKWITKIELVGQSFLGYWQKQGWSDPAPVKTMSLIDGPSTHQALEPGRHLAAGVAFAGDRKISAVEISTDQGATWNPAEVKQSISPFAWSLWQAPIELPAGGSPVDIWVRSVDGAGQVQTREVVESYPDGASGYHKLRVVASN